MAQLDVSIAMETETRVHERRYGAPGVAGSAPLATREDAPPGLLSRVRGAVARWMRTAALVVGTLYAIGWFVLTVGTVMASRQVSWLPDFANTESRMAIAEVARPYALPRDGTMTADEAGVALFRLEPDVRPDPTGFRYRDVGQDVEYPWRDVALPPGSFATAQSSPAPGLPASNKIILAVRSGFSAQERSILRGIATAPFWSAYDQAVRAPQVDVLGGRLVVPFDNPDAVADMIPIARFASTKELAYASVSRAAWHLAEGRRAEAEAAIRSVISHGFVLIDYGTFQIDRLIGAVIVGIGRDALRQYYTVIGDPRAAALVVETERAASSPTDGIYSPPAGASYIGRRNFVRGIVWDPATPPAVVFELGLRGLNAATCSSARELVLGPGPETRAAYARVERDVARFPSEREVGRLMYNDVTKGLPSGFIASFENPSSRVAEVLGRIYANPRLPACLIRIADAVSRGQRLF